MPDTTPLTRQQVYYRANRAAVIARSKAWKAANPERVKQSLKKAAAKSRAQVKKWREDNREWSRSNSRQWYAANKERSKHNAKEWIAANTVRHRAYKTRWQRERVATDPEYRLRKTLRTRIQMAIKGECRLGRTAELLGCSIAAVREHIERQWTIGMSWETFGKRGWHIDHIIPLVMFDLLDDKQRASACHYTNLQPLWWDANLAKGDTLDLSDFYPIPRLQ